MFDYRNLPDEAVIGIVADEWAGVYKIKKLENRQLVFEYIASTNVSEVASTASGALTVSEETYNGWYYYVLKEGCHKPYTGFFYFKEKEVKLSAKVSFDREAPSEYIDIDRAWEAVKAVCGG